MDTEVSDPCWCETSIHLAPVSCSFICFTRVLTEDVLMGQAWYLNKMQYFKLLNIIHVYVSV